MVGGVGGGCHNSHAALDHSLFCEVHNEGQGCGA